MGLRGRVPYLQRDVSCHGLLDREDTYFELIRHCRSESKSTVKMESHEFFHSGLEMVELGASGTTSYDFQYCEWKKRHGFRLKWIGCRTNKVCIECCANARSGSLFIRNLMKFHRALAVEVETFQLGTPSRSGRQRFALWDWFTRFGVCEISSSRILANQCSYFGSWDCGVMSIPSISRLKWSGFDGNQQCTLRNKSYVDEKAGIHSRTINTTMEYFWQIETELIAFQCKCWGVGETHSMVAVLSANAFLALLERFEDLLTPERVSFELDSWNLFEAYKNLIMDFKIQNFLLGNLFPWLSARPNSLFNFQALILHSYSPHSNLLFAARYLNYFTSIFSSNLFLRIT